MDVQTFPGLFTSPPKGAKAADSPPLPCSWGCRQVEVPRGAVGTGLRIPLGPSIAASVPGSEVRPARPQRGSKENQAGLDVSGKGRVSLPDRAQREVGSPDRCCGQSPRWKLETRAPADSAEDPLPGSRSVCAPEGQGAPGPLLSRQGGPRDQAPPGVGLLVASQGGGA